MRYYGVVIVSASTIVMMIMWGGAYSFGIFIKPLISEFGWTRAMTSGAISLAIIVEGTGSILAGRLTDRYGTRVVLSICGLFFGVGYILMSKIDSITQLYIVYGLIVGLGLSGSYVSIMAAVAKWFQSARGLISAIVISSAGIGTLAMAPLANHLIMTRGWRQSFIIVGSIATVFIIAAAQLFRTQPIKHNYKKRDIQLKNIERRKKDEKKSISIREALRDYRLWLICSILLLWGFSKFAILIHITPHAIDLGYSPTKAAHILSMVGAMTFVSTLILGVTADKIGGYSAMIVGLTIMSVSLLWLPYIRELWEFYIFATIFSFGYACGMVLMPTIVAEAFGMKSYGILLGLVNFSGCIGAALGPIMIGYLYDITGEYKQPFNVLAFLTLASLVLSLLITKLNRYIYNDK